MRARSRLVRFAGYGAIGLVAELGFTAAHTVIATRGRRFDSHTSGWMFPVYGLIQPLFEPSHDLLRGRLPAPVRAAAYAAGFLAVEYASGRLYRRFLGEAPWDYSHARWNVDGLIRADYAISWASRASPWNGSMRVATCARAGEGGASERNEGIVMGKTLLAERQDAAGAWHQVMKDVCYGCGCPYMIAEDDHDLVWEPGRKRSRACSDDLCECHTAAVIGERRE